MSDCRFLCGRHDECVTVETFESLKASNRVHRVAAQLEREWPGLLVAIYDYKGALYIVARATDVLDANGRTEIEKYQGRARELWDNEYECEQAVNVLGFSHRSIGFVNDCAHAAARRLRDPRGDICCACFSHKGRIAYNRDESLCSVYLEQA